MVKCGADAVGVISTAAPHNRDGGSIMVRSAFLQYTAPFRISSEGVS